MLTQPSRMQAKQGVTVQSDKSAIHVSSQHTLPEEENISAPICLFKDLTGKLNILNSLYNLV